MEKITTANTKMRKEYLLKLPIELYQDVLSEQRKIARTEKLIISFNKTIHRLLRKALGRY